MNIKTFVEGDIRTNTYVCYEEDGSCFIVDPAIDHKPLDEFLKAQKLTPSFVLLTHGHGDHTEGIPGLKEQYPGLQLAASIKEEDFLAHNYRRYGRKDIKADKWIRDEEELQIGSIGVKFFSTPGHTPGGMCIYVEKDAVLFSGDTLFFCSVGRSDLPGGDTVDLMNSIKTKLFVLPDETKVYPGHMGETTIGYEKRNNPFV